MTVLLEYIDPHALYDVLDSQKLIARKICSISMYVATGMSQSVNV